RSARSSIAYLEMPYAVPGLIVVSGVRSGAMSLWQTGQLISHSPRFSRPIERGFGICTAAGGNSAIEKAPPAWSCSWSVGARTPPAQVGQTYTPSPETACDDANTIFWTG